MTQGGATMKCYDTHLSVGDWTPSDNEYTVTGYVSKYNTPQLAPRSADDLAVIQGIGSSKEDAFSIRTGSNLIVISSDKDAAVEIYNALGQMVKHAALKAGETTVSIAKGMYIVKVMDKTTKVIVK